MKFLRIPVLLAVTVMAFTACSRNDGAAKALETNPLLAYVPADTPFLYANIEPAPAEVIDAFILRAGPSLAAIQAIFDDVEIEINAQDSDEHREARLMAALLGEFDGKFNREGLESLGLSPESHVAVYGMGVFPVARVSLKDAAALKSAISRVEKSSGIDFSKRSLGTSEYWKITDHSDRAGIYIAIFDGHLAFSMFPTAAEEDWLPAFLGQTEVADSTFAARKLTELNADKGYSNYGSGFVDLQRMANEFLDDDSNTASLLKSMGHTTAVLDEQCKSEIRGIISNAPRVVTGVTKLEANTIAVGYHVELEKSLAARLTELVADVPVADSNPEKVLTASLGLNIGRLKNFLVEKATAISEAPFQCHVLQNLNQQAETLLTQLKQPMPPFIGNLKGFRLSMDEIDYQDFSPENARGMFTLEVEKPQMLIGTAKMFVPGFDELEIEPGSDPVELPQELMSYVSGDMRVYAAMSSNSIGVSLGDSTQADLAAFMDARPGDGETFFSIEYDMSAQLDFQDRIRQKMPGSGSIDLPGKENPHSLAKSLQDSYQNWLGRARLEIGFSDDGLQMENTMTFK